MIWLIIYLVGYILSVYLSIKYTLRHWDYTCGDIFTSLVCSLLSWVSVIITLSANIDRDKVIFKKKG